RVVRRRAVLFLVSDFLFASGWRDSLALCARRHDVIAVRLLAPELEAPEGATMRLRDPETGRTAVVDWRSPRARAADAARSVLWRRAVEDDLRRARVDRMDVPVPRGPARDAVARPILDFFTMRERRGEKR